MEIKVGDVIEKDGSIETFTVQHIGKMSMTEGYIYEDVFVVFSDRYGLLECLTKRFVERNYTVVSSVEENHRS